LILAGMIDPAFAQSSDSSLQSTAVSIPGGRGGIGFDDMFFSSELQKVLVPAGHTGKLYLIDPTTFKRTSIRGFSSSASFQKGHKVGITSADEGKGFIFAADHGRKELDAVALNSGKIVATAQLAGGADYVRYVGFSNEIWVTEPDSQQLEIFKLSGDIHPELKLVDRIPVDKGPESLVIDHRRGNAYTNLGQMAVAIDLETHHIVDTWINGCEKSRGDALDDQKGFLFISCAEGKAMVFDLNRQHKKVGSLDADPGVDVISYNPNLSHLYLTSSKMATLSVIGVSAQGDLSLLGKAQAAIKAHCVVSDDQNNIWVCDPTHGQLLRYKDTL